MYIHHVAGEMIRDSKIGEILEKRKEQEVKEINKVSALVGCNC